MPFSPKPCAEFPSDNPELHDGATWICSWTRAYPRAVISARGVARALAAGVRPSATDHAAPEPNVTALESAADTGSLERLGTSLELPINDPSDIAWHPLPTPQPVQWVPEFAHLDGKVEGDLSGLPPADTEPSPGPESGAQMGMEVILPFEDRNTDASSVSEDDPFIVELRELVARLAPRDDLAPPGTVKGGALDTAPEPLELQQASAPTGLDVPCRRADIESLKQAGKAAQRNQPEQAMPAPGFTLQELAARVSPTPPPAGRYSQLERDTLHEAADALAATDAPDPELHPTEVAALAAPSTLISPAPGVTEVPPVSGMQAAAEPRVFSIPRPEAMLSPLSSLCDEMDLIDVDLTPDPPGVRGWLELTERVSHFLLERGATRAAAIAHKLLQGQETNLSRLPTRVAERLLRSNIAQVDGVSLRTTKSFQHQALAFQEAFASGSADPETVFEWIAVAVQALLASDAGGDAIKAHLEQAGVLSLLLRAA
jgi:hypothetical protein